MENRPTADRFRDRRGDAGTRHVGLRLSLPAVDEVIDRACVFVEHAGEGIGDDIITVHASGAAGRSVYS